MIIVDDGEDELHAFAARLGLKRSWFQGGRHPHYDLTPEKRRLAVALGAVEVSGRDFIRRHYRPPVAS